MLKLYLGSCLCGQVTYQVKAFEPYQVHCHCSMCRRFHGAAFASLAEISNENFIWTQGAELVQSYQAENGTIREFCGCCGSSLAMRSNPTSLELALGTLDTPFDSQVKANIYVAFKANWMPLAADLPNCAEDWDECAGEPNDTGNA